MLDRLRRRPRPGSPLPDGAVAVHVRGDRCAVTVHDRTADGLWLAARAVVVESTAAAVGSACHTGMRAGTLAPARRDGDPTSPGDPAQGALGLTSWSALLAACPRSAWVETTAAGIVVETWHVDDLAYVPSGAEPRRLALDVAPELLGRSVLDALR